MSLMIIQNQHYLYLTVGMMETCMLIKLDWSCHGYKLATKILKLQRKPIFSENVITEDPENTLFVTQGFPT